MRSLKLPRSLILPSWLLLALAWGDARGQIVKCTDTNGHVTYQQAPCAAGQQGRAIDIKVDEAPVDAVTWEAAAAAGRVVPGMPKRWVLRARGAPPDIRAATPSEQATETWRYPQTTTVLTVGFAGDAVAWVRDEPRLAGAPGATGAPATAPTPTSPVAASNPRSAENRNSIAHGHTCDSVLAAMGPPDRKEGVQISAATLGGPDILAAATKYIYDAGADANERTAFTCLGGKVADVERAGALKPTARRPAPDR
ncbi:MAG: DUF4124 domain-containing protein [Casimicrobiaceae bacterium]